MRIKVRFFAALREELGAREMVQELPAGATLQALVQQMAAECPVLNRGLSSLHFALNHRYVTLEAVLQDGDEVAFLPPVGGG